MDVQRTSSSGRLPEWLRRPLRLTGEVHSLRSELRQRKLNTVCEEARCPNLNECWSRRTATLMILGDVCTRHCGFCSIDAGVPRAVDPTEPEKAAEMVAALGLRHAVITCVARDDLPDGGAGHFVKVITAVRGKNPQTRIEILTTDFGMERRSMETVCGARPDVFNHNLETVERLSPRVRHRAGYRTSLEFLRRIREFDSRLTTKSGLMLGLGEERAEVLQALRDLREAGCSIVTIGQYLRPTPRNLPVAEYVRPEVFHELEKKAYAMGFTSVASGPFVRSSYHADEMVK